jgi:hypothetical protein
VGTGSGDLGELNDPQFSLLQMVNTIQEIQMIRFLGMLVVLSVLVAGIGYYRGWFRAASIDTNGQDTIKLTVDKDKLNQDKASAQQQVRDLGHK